MEIQTNTRDLARLNNKGSQEPKKEQKTDIDSFIAELSSSMLNFGSLKLNKLNKITKSDFETRSRVDVKSKQDYSKRVDKDDRQVQNKLETKLKEKSINTGQKSADQKVDDNFDHKNNIVSKSQSKATQESAKSEKKSTDEKEISTEIKVKSDQTSFANNMNTAVDQINKLSQYDNASLNIRVKNTGSPQVNPQNVVPQEFSQEVANIETMSDNMTNSEGKSDLFGQGSAQKFSFFKKTEKIDKLNMSLSAMGKLSEKTTEVAKSMKFEKVARVKIQNFSSKLTGMIKTVPSGTSSTARLVLNPESLGTVFVEMDMEQGVLKLKIKAQTQEALDKLDGQIADLKGKLAQQGIKTESFEISLMDQQDSLADKKGFDFSQQQNDDMKTRKDFVKSFESLQKDETQDTEFVPNVNTQIHGSSLELYV